MLHTPLLMAVKLLRVPLLKLENGKMGMMPFKVGKINNILSSVKDLCSRGNRVVFDDDGSCILNKMIGDTIKIYETGRTYAFPVEVVAKSIALKLAAAKNQSKANPKLSQLHKSEDESSTKPFQRHASKL